MKVLHNHKRQIQFFSHTKPYHTTISCTTIRDNYNSLVIRYKEKRVLENIVKTGKISGRRGRGIQRNDVDWPKNVPGEYQED